MRVLPSAAALALAAGLAGASAPLSAQMGMQAGSPPHALQGAVVLKAARMLDVASGRMIPNATLVVEGGRITAVNPSSTPDGAHVVDLGDVTLLPGFIDAHTHLSSEISASSFTAAVTQTLADATLGAVKYGQRTVLAGFTTVRDFGGDATVAYGRAVERGDVAGPHVIPSRSSIGVTGGHCDVTGFAPGIAEQDWREGVADGVDEVLKAVRYQVKHGAQVIKTCATAGVLSMEGPVGAQQYSQEELEAMVEEAARHGLKVAAHAHGSEGILAAVRAGVASVEHGSMLTDEIIAEMKARGTYLVPTTYLVDRIPMDALPAVVRAKAEYVLPFARASVEKAIGAGVKIAFGTDAGVYPHGENAGEFAIYVRMGMSPLDALRTATLNAADLLGKDDRGVLAEGKLADIIAVAGDPLADIEATKDVRFVMVGGRVVKHVAGGMGGH
jgi:imidazolonepropionase-like amidohydrolase